MAALTWWLLQTLPYGSTILLTSTPDFTRWQHYHDVCTRLRQMAALSWRLHRTSPDGSTSCRRLHQTSPDGSTILTSTPDFTRWQHYHDVYTRLRQMAALSWRLHQTTPDGSTIMTYTSDYARWQHYHDVYNLHWEPITRVCHLGVF